MESEIIVKAQKLKEELANSLEIKRVKELEKEMLDDDEVGLLIMHYQTVQNDLNEAIRFKTENNELYARLSQTKQELYSHPKVKEYLEALKAANKLLQEVSVTLFADVWKIKGVLDL